MGTIGNMEYFNDNGHLADEALSLYAEALKLDQLEQAPEALREHLEQCPYCQEQAMALYALIAEQDYSELGPHPTFGQGGPTTAATLKMWFRPLLLLLMALLAFFFFRQQQKQEQPVPAMEEHTPAPAPSAAPDTAGSPLSPPQALEIPPGQSTRADGQQKSNLKNFNRHHKESQTSPLLPSSLAANYEPSETLESLVGAVTRSQGLSDIQPKNGKELEIGKAVVFSWQGSPEEPLTLRLLNNREEEAFSYSVEGNRIIGPAALQPGLYYWKLETDDDLLHVGKFLVR